MSELAPKSAPRGLARAMAALIRFYQLGISPLLRPSCRFAPTCSEYAVEALTVHGAGRGSWLAVRRLLRCHPFCEGGYDPVPASRRAESAGAALTEVEPSAAQPATESASRPTPVAASISAARSTSQEAGECLC